MVENAVKHQRKWSTKEERLLYQVGGARDRVITIPTIGVEGAMVDGQYRYVYRQLDGTMAFHAMCTCEEMRGGGASLPC